MKNNRSSADFPSRLFLLATKTMILIISSLLLIGNVLESAIGEKNLQFANGLNSPLIIRDIHTLPSSIYVNDTFSIIATLMNNSTTTLMISNNGCKGEPLTASFDKNVDVIEGNHICNLFISSSFPMKPNATKTITTGNKNDLNSDHYKARLPGIITSVLKIEFEIKDANQDTKFASCTYHNNSVSPCIFKFPIVTKEK